MSSGMWTLTRAVLCAHMGAVSHMRSLPIGLPRASAPGRQAPGSKCSWSPCRHCWLMSHRPGKSDPAPMWEGTTQLGGDPELRFMAVTQGTSRPMARDPEQLNSKQEIISLHFTFPSSEVEHLKSMLWAIPPPINLPVMTKSRWK